MAEASYHRLLQLPGSPNQLGCAGSLSSRDHRTLAPDTQPTQSKRRSHLGSNAEAGRTTGSQSRESFIPGPTSVSLSGTRGKSRMHKGARTDPCGGRGVTRAPTATRKRITLTVER